MGFRKRVDRDEEMTRFGWLVGAVIVVELFVLALVASSYGIGIRPLG